MPTRTSPTSLDPSIAARLKRTPDGLVPAVVQQHDTGEVLMLGWMDDQALHRTLTTGRATYFSRSRREYWVKGETSGHFQYVRSVALDCDGDTLLVRVEQVGAACHTGDRTCFDADVLPVSAPDGAPAPGGPSDPGGATAADPAPGTSADRAPGADASPAPGTSGAGCTPADGDGQ